jgi:hypothetical protein
MSATIRRMRVIDPMPMRRPTQMSITVALRRILPDLEHGTRAKFASVIANSRAGTLDGVGDGGLCWRWNGTTLLVDREEGETR